LSANNRKDGYHWRGLTNPLLKTAEYVQESRVPRDIKTAVRHPERRCSNLLPKDPTPLSINGMPWDERSFVCKPMPNEAPESDAWKSVIREWEPEGLEFDPASCPGLRYPRPLKAFWITLMQNNMYMPKDKSPEPWEEAHESYHEQYLILTGRISASEIKNSLFIHWLQDLPLETIIGAFSQQILWKLRGWK